MKLPGNIHTLALISVMAAILFAAGCTEKNNTANPLVPFLFQSCPAINVPAGATVMQCGSVVNDNRTYYYYLLKLEYDGNEPSYAMWIPPENGGVKPVVVMTNPYDGIRWNGDNPPSYVSVFDMLTYVKSANIFLINGFGVLHVFGRFYTRGNLQNDVEDMTAGLRFLRDSGFADIGKIGIWGASWGGFEALYGAANAPSGAAPAVGVAFYPPSDFVEQERYFNTDVPALVTDPDKKSYYIDFFDEYLLRMHNTADLNAWTADALIGKLTTPFLVIHDEWDTLVPVTQSQYLVDHSSGMVKPVWFYQDTPVDLNERPYFWNHGELREYQLDSNPPDAFLYGICNTMATAFIINRLAAADQPVVLGYDVNALNDFVEYIRDYKCAHGKTTGWAAERLLDIVDGRVILIDFVSLTVISGAEGVARAFQFNNWGDATYQSSLTVAGALAGGLPACP